MTGRLTAVLGNLTKRFLKKERMTIATVYSKRTFARQPPRTMDTVMWLRTSESLAALGFRVDMIGAPTRGVRRRHPNLRSVPFSRVRWHDYGVIKTFFHEGYECLQEETAGDHPWVISNLGSVVGSSDETAGVHFFGDGRRRLYEIQREIAARSRFVTVLTEPSKQLWEQEFGCRDNVRLVPTGVDRRIPRPRENPYAAFSERIAVYIGNLYFSEQKEINLLWQDKLCALGTRLRAKGIRLCFVGVGDTDRLDPAVVTDLGVVDNDRIWDYQYFAHVGIALAQGRVQHNESSKLYYYLRTGLPVVSEEPIPNNHVIRESGLGFVAPYGDTERMADLIEAAVLEKKWNREEAIRYILEHHTWDERAKRYEQIIRGLSM